jgi:hypothetical protein
VYAPKSLSTGSVELGNEHREIISHDGPQDVQIHFLIPVDQSVARADNLSLRYFSELGSRWLRDCAGRLTNDLDEAYNRKRAHLVAVKDRSIATDRGCDRFFGRIAHVL